MKRSNNAKKKRLLPLTIHTYIRMHDAIFNIPNLNIAWYRYCISVDFIQTVENIFIVFDKK